MRFRYLILIPLLLCGQIDALELLLVRHGQTDWNAQKRCQGQQDIPMNEEGRRQADQVRIKLSDLKLSAVYSSDLGRTIETATIAQGPRKLPIHTDPRLRELRYGALEGLPMEKFPVDHFLELFSLPIDQEREGVETRLGVFKRLGAALNDIVAAHQDDERVLIVTHGGAIRAMVEGVIHNDANLGPRFENCECVVVSVDSNGEMHATGML